MRRPKLALLLSLLVCIPLLAQSTPTQSPPRSLHRDNRRRRRHRPNLRRYRCRIDSSGSRTA